MIEYRAHITRAMLRAEPEKLFVFGDNELHTGYGGQAKEMRWEPNAIGIPTKKWPSMEEEAFFTDNFTPYWATNNAENIAKLLIFEGTIIWPQAGIGTGLAQLKERAPLIWRAIERLRIGLEKG
ncbi:hypothetical protein LCGC14_1914150 [marine sediment metagenome]|uniref:DUF7831 domain-containing protein n=1 Tax=marine sediment metagenome TaxID=412755 RepID=A0A0F9IQS8_9ZZZZ